MKLKNHLHLKMTALLPIAHLRPSSQQKQQVPTPGFVRQSSGHMLQSSALFFQSSVPVCKREKEVLLVLSMHALLYTQTNNTPLYIPPLQVQEKWNLRLRQPKLGQFVCLGFFLMVSLCGDLIAAFQYLKGACKNDGDRFF